MVSQTTGHGNSCPQMPNFQTQKTTDTIPWLSSGSSSLSSLPDERDSSLPPERIASVRTRNVRENLCTSGKNSRKVELNVGAFSWYENIINENHSGLIPVRFKYELHTYDTLL